MARLATLTQNDPVKMEKFFSASTRGQRDKWKKREDYRALTIKAAIERMPPGAVTEVMTQLDNPSPDALAILDVRPGYAARKYSPGGWARCANPRC